VTTNSLLSEAIISLTATFPTSPKTTATTTRTTTTTPYPIIWNCNFDTNTILSQQCGNVTSAIGPTLSGPTWGVVANDAVTGTTPALVVTDILSISITKFGYSELIKIFKFKQAQHKVHLKFVEYPFILIALNIISVINQI
jgi:hypothetical protein